MPRTLPAALTTAMDSGNYEPYLKVVVSEDGGSNEVTVDPLYFKLEHLRATVRIAKFDEDSGLYGYFRLVRGAVISGSPVTISSIAFKTREIIFNGQFVTLIGEIVHNAYLTVAANSTYEAVINTVIGYMPNGAKTFEGTAPWKTYQFYPTGKTIVINGLMKLFTMLSQKYLTFATEDGFDGINNNLFFFVATDTRAQDYTFTDLLFSTNFTNEFRKLIWRDENNTVHTNGSASVPLHNLGFLQSTASAPPNVNSSYIGSRSSKLPVHLKYRTGDYASNTNTGLNGFSGRIKVTEVFDPNSTPSWYIILEKLVWFDTTEGGPLPSTIEAAAPYTPLVTGNFDGILSANENNIQAAFEKIDDSVPAPIQAPTATNDFLVGAQVSGVWTWLKKTLAETITILRTSLDGVYATLAGTREKLTATRTYYIRTDGSDSNNGLANTAGGAFLTWQHAIDIVTGGTLDFGGQTVTIQIGDGTYTAGVTISKPWTGGGALTIQGNSGTPTNVVLSVTSASGIVVSCPLPGTLTTKDFKVTCATSGACFNASGSGTWNFSGIDFGACVNGHIVNTGTGMQITAIGNYAISGGSFAHVNIAGNGSSVTIAGVTVTLTGTPAFSGAFAYTTFLSVIQAYSNTWSGSATGSRYSIASNSILFANGEATTTLPGNSAGTTGTGGQYI